VGIQAGLRAEHVTGTIEASALGEDVALAHTGIFPSANVSWSLGAGRQLRLSYAKRIQRPLGSMLNPMDNTPADPFNRSVGNPWLGPTDVHTLSADASWTGSMGTLRVSQFAFQGSNLWDQVRTVDGAGVMTSMMQNLASARQYGVNLNGSLRELGPFSGSASLGIYRLNFDTGNLAGLRPTSSSSWTLNGNIVTTLTPTLRVQTTGFYSPGQVSPQGRYQGFRSLNVSATQRILEDRAVLTLSLVDPFGLSRTTFTSQQATHEQTSRSANRVRRATLSISYNFGRAPQSSRRVIQDDPTGGGGGVTVPGAGVQ